MLANSKHISAVGPTSHVVNSSSVNSNKNNLDGFWSTVIKKCTVRPTITLDVILPKPETEVCVIFDYCLCWSIYKEVDTQVSKPVSSEIMQYNSTETRWLNSGIGHIRTQFAFFDKPYQVKKYCCISLTRRTSIYSPWNGRRNKKKYLETKRIIKNKKH